MGPILILASLIPFYALGAIPCGTIVARFAGVNITEHGSGNVGATNVARVVGKRAGLYTLILDVFKGAAAIAISFLVSTDPTYHGLAGFTAVLGHTYSIPGKLKGGKGVATSLGVFLCIAPTAALLGLITFGIVFIAKHIVSLASITAALIIPVIGMFLPLPEQYQLCLACVSLLVVYKHKDNLKRLIEGREQVFQAANK